MLCSRCWRQSTRQRQRWSNKSPRPSSCETKNTARINRRIPWDSNHPPATSNQTNACYSGRLMLSQSRSDQTTKTVCFFLHVCNDGEETADWPPPVVRGLHQRRPARNGVLLVDVAALLHEQLHHVEPPDHGGEHQRRRAVQGETRVTLGQVLLQNLP